MNTYQLAIGFLKASLTTELTCTLVPIAAPLKLVAGLYKTDSLLNRQHIHPGSCYELVL